MGVKVINLKINFDDMSGMIYPGYEGEIFIKGHDALHSGHYILKGKNKTMLMKELNNYIWGEW